MLKLIEKIKQRDLDRQFFAINKLRKSDYYKVSNRESPMLLSQYGKE